MSSQGGTQAESSKVRAVNTPLSLLDWPCCYLMLIELMLVLDHSHIFNYVCSRPKRQFLWSAVYGAPTVKSRTYYQFWVLFMYD